MRHGLPRLSIRLAAERKSLAPLAATKRREVICESASSYRDADASLGINSLSSVILAEPRRPETWRDSPFDSRDRIACAIESLHKRPRTIKPRAFDTRRARKEMKSSNACSAKCY